MGCNPNPRGAFDCGNSVAGRDDQNLFDLLTILRRGFVTADEGLFSEHFCHEENQDGSTQSTSGEKIDKGVAGCSKHGC